MQRPVSQGAFEAARMAWSAVAHEADALVIVRRLPMLGETRLIVSAHAHHAACAVSA